MKKNQHSNLELVYIHLNERDQYVITSGFEFNEFTYALSDSLSNILLIKHRYEDGDFNSDTQLEYVQADRLGKLITSDVSSYQDFCWIDFEDVENLNFLTGQELAEILYLGHKKHHLRPPFYNQLENRYVYLASEDGWYNKTYYRNLNHFYTMAGSALSAKMSVLKPEKSLLGVKKKRTYPAINKDLIKSLIPFMREGAVFSFQNTGLVRNKPEIPIWTIGDFADMDEMREEFKHIGKQRWDSRLIYDKKTREWEISAE
ncbi:hypothetical protein [Mesobacillus harenae]|uniref:hypothetical protein n=1 Tax=Mesobacillus harenae TaxID=2213203 RepID=UPI001580D709|nr:hypothetical protein [Mesobacillus harenae]